MSLLYTRIARQRRRYDPDARLYLRLVENALGAATTLTQRNAVSGFIRAEKTASRWTSIKRLYLPIWGNAAANAVCLKSLASGTFVGGVTHGAGYVQGDGSTGYFNFGSTPSAQGLTTSSSGYFILISQAGSLSGTRAHIACSDNAANTIFAGLSNGGGGGVLIAGFGSLTDAGGFVSTSLAHTNTRGIITASRVSGSSFIQRRLTAGNSTLQTDSDAGAGAIPSTRNLVAMAFNYNGTISTLSDAQYGAWGTHAGYASSDLAAFTLNLKTLWETCTGLTLP
jgi:hypothetical protein